MSRTTKDKPWPIQSPDHHSIADKPKRAKKKDTEWHWMSTPSWWTRLMMNRPQRRKGKLWEAGVKFEAVTEETDPPGASKKPHKYFW